MIARKFGKEELLKWLHSYNQNESPEEKESEQRLSEILQRTGFVTKDEAIELLAWKFFTNPFRLKRELLLLNKNTEDEIIQKTKEALLCKTDEEKIKLLRKIKGFGTAVCSVVLTFSNPREYGIFDTHVWHELYGTPLKGKDDTLSNSVKFFEDLRKISKETGLTCREVEKAIFQKNFEESRNAGKKMKPHAILLIVKTIISIRK